MSRRAALVLFLLLSAAPAGAATFVVDTTTDADDGACTRPPGGCTLREAMNAAVATAGRDTIAFDPAVFPLGNPGLIAMATTTPVLADPAGTVVDGIGAGVIIDTLQGSHGLAFASAPGVPLAKVRVANVTVRGGEGSGILICGGSLPDCDADVSKPVVENVVVTDNEESGVEIRGRDVIKARLTNAVALRNGSAGIAVEAAGALVGTKIDGCTAQRNGLDSPAPGIALRGAKTASTSISDSTAVDNDGIGVLVRADETFSKAKLTKVVATRNDVTGISVGGGDQSTGIALTDTVTVENQSGGLFIFGRNVVSPGVKGAVANRNGGHGVELSVDALLGAKITGVRAVGNELGGIVIGERDVSGVQVTRSVVTENGGIGLYLLGSGNTVKLVRADGNGAGIQLDGPGSGNTIEQSTAHANDGPAGGAGIAVGEGNTSNVIRKNAAQLNDGPNLADGNPSCDGNQWSDNSAITSDPCLD